MNSQDCYSILDLQEGASIQEIKIAYRRLALRYHPDKNTSTLDGEKFKAITEAYQMLKVGQKGHIRANQGFYSKTFVGKGLGPILRKLNPSKIFKEKLQKHARGTDRACHDFTKYALRVLKYPAVASKNAVSALVHSDITRYNQIPSIMYSQVHAHLLKKCRGIEMHVKNNVRLFCWLLHPITMRALHPCYLTDLRRLGSDRQATVHEMESVIHAYKLSSVNDFAHENISTPFEYNRIKHCMNYKIPMLHYAQIDGKFGKFSGIERNRVYFAAIPQVMEWDNKPHGAMNLDEMEALNAHHYGRLATGDTLVDPTVRWRSRHLLA